MDTTDVLSNYVMTVDMRRFALMWLVYSRNKFFRVGPNISEKFVPGGTNFRGVQIKRDKTLHQVSATFIMAHDITLYVFLIRQTAEYESNFWYVKIVCCMYIAE